MNWTEDFSKNVYTKDGRDISPGDAGMISAAPALLSTDNADHLSIFLHSYDGTGGNKREFRRRLTVVASGFYMPPLGSFSAAFLRTWLSAINADISVGHHGSRQILVYTDQVKRGKFDLRCRGWHGSQHR